MERLKGSKPSPAIMVSIIALVFALVGTAAAGVATVSVLSKKEKKQTRNIARDEIRKAVRDRVRELPGRRPASDS